MIVLYFFGAGQFIKQGEYLMATEKIINKAAKYLETLSRRRANGVVTADDVQNYLSKQKFSSNQNERLSVVRSVLQVPRFYPMGEQKSTRPKARGRTIRTWVA